MTANEKKIFTLITKASLKYKLIEENDKILVAVSDGKDSLTLIHDLIHIRKLDNLKRSGENP